MEFARRGDVALKRHCSLQRRLSRKAFPDEREGADVTWTFAQLTAARSELAVALKLASS
jgi:hypothetical protein